MELDTSTYPKSQPYDPLKTLGGVANLQNTLNQNKLFQQQFNTNKAVSDIYKRAVKPDGTLDMDQIRDEVSKNPDAAYGLEQVFKGAQGLQQGQIQTNSAQIDLARKNIDIMGSYLTPLESKVDKDGKPNATNSDVMASVAQAILSGHVDPKVIGPFIADLPTDNSQVPAWIKQKHLQFLDTQSRFNAMHPVPTQVDTGPNINLMRLPQQGEPSLAGVVQKGLPPTTPVFPAGGGQPSYAGASQGGAGGGMGQPGQTGGGAAFASNPPGFETAKNADAGVSVEQGRQLTARADQAQNNKAILGNMESELGNVNTGPGTESVAKFEKFLNANVFPKGFQYNVEGLSDREKLNKLAGLYIQTQFQSLGGTGTDAKLDAAGLTSPNSELSKLGIKGLIALAKGNEDAIQAKGRAWTDYAAAGGLQNYRQFSTQFNKNYDPRVFQSQYLDGGEKQKLLKGMTPTEQGQFRQAYNFAVQNGWIPDPRGR